MAFSVEHELVDGTLLVTAAGDLDQHTPGKVIGLIEEFLEAGGKKIVFDRLRLVTTGTFEEMELIANSVVDAIQSYEHILVVLAPADDIFHQVALGLANLKGIRVVAFTTMSEAWTWLEEQD